MRWGFSHDLGPFELWDALGVRKTAEAMEANGVAVAPWVARCSPPGTRLSIADNGLPTTTIARRLTVPKDRRAQIEYALRLLGASCEETRARA